MASNDVCLGLDIGERRIGVAIGDTIGRLAMPLVTIQVKGGELEQLRSLIAKHDITKLIVGLPRNGSGAETKQNEMVRAFVGTHLQTFDLPVIFQDESVTSILAEERLAARKKSYAKSDIDAEAAAIILQDYLEMYHAGHSA